MIYFVIFFLPYMLSFSCHFYKTADFSNFDLETVRQHIGIYPHAFFSDIQPELYICTYTYTLTRCSFPHQLTHFFSNFISFQFHLLLPFCFNGPRPGRNFFPRGSHSCSSLWSNSDGVCTCTCIICVLCFRSRSELDQWLLQATLGPS